MSKPIPEKKMGFLPEDYVERQIERRTSFMCLGMFAVILLGSTAVFGFKWTQLNEARKVRESVNEQFTEAARRLEQLDALQKRRSEMLRKAQITATLLERVPRSFLLADLVNRMPQSLSLLEMDYHSKVVKALRPNLNRSALANKTANKKAKGEQKEDESTPEPVPIKTVTLSLTGVAPTDVQVSQYIKALGESPLFSSVDLVFSEESKIQDIVMRRFQLDMVLSHTADVRAMQPELRQQNRPRDPTSLPTTTVPIPDDSGESRARGANNGATP